MTDLCTDVGCVSVNKFGEQLCGDHVEVVSRKEGATVVVLADGLGSGVKASILSILTAKIISTMVANSLPLEDCVSTIAAALPVCRQRKVAYSTFTIIRVSECMEAEVIQYDNPNVILLRDGRNVDYPRTSETIDGKTIYKSRITLAEDDTFVAVSDGAVYAGAGLKLNPGWRREDIVAFLERVFRRETAAGALSALLLDKCLSLYEGRPGDDTTVCTVKIRRRMLVNLLFGPPEDPADVPKMMSLFFSKRGRHIVCGGTTSQLAAKFLQKPLDTSPSADSDPDIPPTSKIEGVDLVTEGVITMSRVFEYAKGSADGSGTYGDWHDRTDGASRIAKMLFEEATDINFFVGRAVNPAHQKPGLPIRFSVKINLVENLEKYLKKMGKTVKISYF